MELNYKSKNGRFAVKFDGDSQKDVFEQLADFQSVFEGNDVCQLCQKDNVVFNARDVDGNKYYEKKCLACGAALTFHQNKKGGGLYTSYKDRWQKWTPGPKDEDDKELFDTPQAKKGKNK